MAKILVFPGKTTPTLRGPARCLHCGHIWEAVSPEGVIDCLECPTCSLSTGVRIGICEPEHGIRFVCPCGCDLYYILPHGCQCLRCGVLATGF